MAPPRARYTRVFLIFEPLAKKYRSITTSSCARLSDFGSDCRQNHQEKNALGRTGTIVAAAHMTPQNVELMSI
jgi:hypothetical protein